MNPIETYANQTLTPDELRTIRAQLKADPNLWRTHGDVATWCREKTLSGVPENTLRYESVQFGMNQMREDLLKDGDSQIERMIVEQIITIWLLVGSSAYQLESTVPSDQNENQIRRLERRYNQDQLRLTRCISLLNRVRKTLLDGAIKKNRNRIISPAIVEQLSEPKQEPIPVEEVIETPKIIETPKLVQDPQTPKIPTGNSDMDRHIRKLIERQQRPPEVN